MNDRGPTLLKLAREASAGMKSAESEYYRYARIEKIAKDLIAGKSTVITDGSCSRVPLAVVRPASTLSMIPSAEGKFRVSIDGCSPFEVSELQGQILQILAMDAAASDDGLVAWKSCKSIIEALRLMTGKKISRRALVQAIYLLRERMTLNKLERGLIQNSRRRAAYRFALRRKPAESGANSTTSAREP